MVKPRNAAEAHDINELITEARNRMYFDKSISTYRMREGYELGRRHPNDHEHMGDAMRRLQAATERTVAAMRAICPEAFAAP